MREELPSAAFTNREDSPLPSELSTLAAKRKIGKNPSFASCVNVRKYKNAPRKILRRFFFRRGHFPLSSEGSGKTVRSWESIRFFLRRRLFKLGRGYNTEASSSELTLSENQDAYLVFKTDGSCFRRDIDYRNYH